LWDDYLAFYRTRLDEQTTEATFKRLCDRVDRMHGLIALDDEDHPIGFAHLVLHPSTWAKGSYCYLEDLFVAREARGGDTARQLILAVYQQADKAQASRVYWHTQEFNAPARSLYDQVGHRTSFVMYER
jgi:GNAT superfamily N-acetyltransferase